MFTGFAGVHGKYFNTGQQSRAMDARLRLRYSIRTKPREYD
jgi:hypothetical protein